MIDWSIDWCVNNNNNNSNDDDDDDGYVDCDCDGCEGCRGNLWPVT